ncbi:MAG: hypothetical protein N2442_02665 [Spirochaetes bacterium]|nr:hypothetical protein [Spirochaetota bacterium]
MQIAYILSISFGSVLLGYILKSQILSPRVLSDRLKQVAVMVLLPLAAISSLWSFAPASGKLALLSLLGAGSLFLGGVAAIFCIHWFHIEPYRAGSFFSSSMFYNISALAAFIAFVLYGEEGFAYIQIYALFEQPIYYIIGFPLSYAISKADLHSFRVHPRVLLEKKVAFFPLGAVLIGTLLRLSGIPKPQFMYQLSHILVPVITVFFGLAIGLTLKIGAISQYRKEILLVHLIKFLFVPACLIPLGILIGFGSIRGGLPLKTLVIVSFSPVAFLAAIPPAIYGFDVDLANSTWLTSTISYMVLLPGILFLATRI